MTSVADLIVRCQQWLQDEDAKAYQAAQVQTQLALEASRLANGRILGAVVAAQAVTNRHVYPLDAMGTLITTGTATGGSATTVVDGTKDFGALGVTSSRDRIRNLTDGSLALVTSVTTTTLTASAGWTGGVTNTASSGDVYLVETPITAQRIVEIAAVQYNGERLSYTTERELDARYDGWETWTGEPRYWLTDSATTPTELRIVPAPLRTGSAAVQIPPVPFVLDWHDNLVVWLSQDAPDLPAGTTDHGLPQAYEDLLTFNTVGTLAGWQSDYENVSLQQLLPTLGAIWEQALQPGE
jgi:hypothetical protein